jgi:hypothetical protein
MSARLSKPNIPVSPLIPKWYRVLYCSAFAENDEKIVDHDVAKALPACSSAG